MDRPQTPDGEPALDARPGASADTRTEATVGEIEALPQPRRMLLSAARTFLVDDPITRDVLTMDDAALVEELQRRFQRSLERHYEASGIRRKVIDLCAERARVPSEQPLDAAICDLVAQNSGGTGYWTRESPVLRTLYPTAGYNCTMGSALLQTALRDAGFSDARTVLRQGHYVTARMLEDGSVRILDSSSMHTEDAGTDKERLAGYVRDFPPSQVRDRREVAEPGGRRGIAFTLVSDTEDEIGGITRERDGGFEQRFYANDPSVKIDLAIALENLSEIKDDALKAERPDEHLALALDGYRQGVAEYLARNNETPLDARALAEIARANFQPVNELTAAAQAAFAAKTPGPDPFDFLQSPLLRKRAGAEAPPDPRQYAGSAEQYEEASMLCERFPELRQLDFAALKERFGLFHGYDYLKGEAS